MTRLVENPAAGDDCIVELLDDALGERLVGVDDVQAAPGKTLGEESLVGR